MAKTGFAVGLNRGHKTTPFVSSVKRRTHHSGVPSERTLFVRSIAQEVTGFAPYERRLMDMIRNSQDKRAKKFAKKKLGAHKRALKKIEALTSIVAEARRAGH